MADINQIVTLGIGTPADIEHFILVGLNGVAVVETPIFNLDHTVFVHFRDKRTVSRFFRDKRVNISFRDKRIS